MKWSSENGGRHHFIPDVRRKELSLSQVRMEPNIGILTDNFYQAEKIPSSSSLLRVLHILLKCLFHINGFDHFFWTVNVMEFIGRFSVVELVLHIHNKLHYIHNKLHLVMIQPSFYMLLNFISKYFVEDFYIYFHEIYWPEVFLYCLYTLLSENC